MKIAYLIAAHNNPKHLKRLVSALQSDSVAFFIHIDKKSDIKEFSAVAGDNVYFVKPRIAVYWADYSQVEATCVLINSALIHLSKFDRFVFISGTDYPIRSAQYIHHFFTQNKDKEFINIVPLLSNNIGKPISRLTNYKTYSQDSLFKKLSKKVSVLLKLSTYDDSRDYKPVFKDLIPYGGSSWWALTRGACECIEQFMKAKPEIGEFLKNTKYPDETIFQTILGNSAFKENMCSNLTFADWSEGNANPALITADHLSFFKRDSYVISQGEYGKGEVLFARKFSDACSELIEQVEIIKMRNK